ncbi:MULTISPECIES: RNA-guided endonuclease IscB [unclassified Microcoleus]|uniref:RNA-guided endonuclease IscB n=1 Tax=unclassified Microcoleus TaxID=2642155 RepID=UPI001D41CD4A|nr:MULTISPECIES: RNA-guided endonuclease IscB [unclassified Microcoleus]MCC3443726.1 RRXRR domain-containing protein [Microcoleus sp. PH2017_03_ELD_O_A]MCC3505699.1 RRXRR domain-containing protein [Microcoleus sp. PH2017_19_SFW_U_A]TAG90587.1 MAG: HNH endonuclease [Oscillatoriales cyanobacterium]MCC3525721.1 RRXRR domain-containing protein [Microcoleus sp. PH2017_20_SFW_D_A]MCC3556681.1 RRXRR domain-containing protein [Microcoleus sp. PH2017_35_SFW_U_B]
MQNYVFLLNADRTPLDMIHSARARELQSKGKAKVFRQVPYVLILQNQILNPVTKQYSIKIDPGAKWTGFALQCGDEILFRMEMQHRGDTIESNLLRRAGFRRGRRSRNLRYRKKRFNRTKPEGWLAPSLRHRLQTVETWIKRFIRYCPVTCIEIEQVRFDTQKLINPEIDGTEYQQGELMGYEMREYLLQKWGRKCAYCGVENVPLEVEHIHPKSKGGSDRVSNLTLACHTCNQAKGDQDVRDFLSGKPDLLNQILQQVKQPLKDAAAVNSTRFAIVRVAKTLCEKVNCWTGGRTKFNRCSQGLEKSHSIDAACVGASGESIKLKTNQPLIVMCKGHGNRQARRVNASGFPAVHNAKEVFHHVTAGDIVKVFISKDRKKVKAGIYTTRVKTPTKKGCEVLIDGNRISLKNMNDITFVHRNDGYGYGY